MAIDFIDPKTLPEYKTNNKNSIEDNKIKVLSPGDIVTTDSAYMKGHGSYIDEDGLMRSSLSGVTQIVNRLITVKSLRGRYGGEIGDVIIGRIEEIQQRLWKVDIESRRDANLNLASIYLPGGIQRRKSESDELKMREFFKEGDLLVAEIQSYSRDGQISLHTRNRSYGKLKNGSLFKVPANLIQRSRTQFITLNCDIDLILGLNGWIWVSKHLEPISEDKELEYEDMYLDRNDDISNFERESIARIGCCIMALSSNSIFLNETNISLAYEVSLSFSLKELSSVEAAEIITNNVLSQIKL